MNAGFQYDFFLSHSVKDKAVVRAFSRFASNRERCRPAHSGALSAIRFLSLLAAALTAMGAIVRGGIFDDTNAINVAVDLATTNAFCEPVGQIGILYNGVWYVSGGGSAISSNFILAAAHQAVLGQGVSVAGLRYTIRNNTDNSIIGRFYADWWIVHPGYSGIGQGPDALIIHLTNSVPVTPVTRFRGQDVIGTPVYPVGYGDVGVASNSDPLVYDGRKRLWTNSVSMFGSGIAIDGNYLVTRFTPGTWQGAPGDSGGALFVNVNGEMQLAGILACVSPAGGRNYGDRTGSTRISLINPWIDQVMASLSPALRVVQVDATTVTLSWPSPAPGFVLQQTTNLTDWTISVATVSDDGTNKRATFTSAGAQTFWRLIAQPVSGPVSTLRPGLAKLASDLNATNRDVGDLLRLVREPEE